jgi:hypothetical protein
LQKVVFMVACTVPGMRIGSAEQADWLRQGRPGAWNHPALALRNVHGDVAGPRLVGAFAARRGWDDYSLGRAAPAYRGTPDVQRRPPR